MKPDDEIRTILHLDMNAYFASVEQKANPLLRGKPVLMVADARRRSVVVTSSYEARSFGVKTGMNLYEAKKFCPHAMVVEVNSEKYLDSTAKIMRILERFTDQVEMFSCDEAFLDVTRSQKYFGTDGEGIAGMLKAAVKSEVALPCSIGVAPNKLLAKLASEKHKPDGLTLIRPEEVGECLSQTPVEDLCGIGSKVQSKLNQLGITTCKDLGEANLSILHNLFGFLGYGLKRMGQGKDDSPVKKITDLEEAKSFGHSTTFPRDTSDPKILKSFLLLLSEKVASRLRKKCVQGRTISLTIRYRDFTTFTRQSRRDESLNDGYGIFLHALGILEKLTLKQSVRLLGVSVSSLVPDLHQEYLFQSMATRKHLNDVRDEINRKFGTWTLRPASLLFADRFGVLEPPIPPRMIKE